MAPKKAQKKPAGRTKKKPAGKIKKIKKKEPATQAKTQKFLGKIQDLFIESYKNGYLMFKAVNGKRIYSEKATALSHLQSDGVRNGSAWRNSIGIYLVARALENQSILFFHRGM